VSLDGQGFGDLIRAWDGVGVVLSFDAPTGTWIFIAIHDDTLGMALGGCRMKVYPRAEDGLRDAMRLAEGMTFKWAAMDFPYGGGKTVLAIPGPLESSDKTGLLHRFGELLNSLKGAYGTGEDLGTTPADMREIATVSEYVIGVHGIDDGPSDPGPFTARGVFEGIRSSLRHRYGTDDLADRTVLVQGVGHVGGPLARLLSGADASVLVSDADADKAATMAGEIGGGIVNPDDVYDTKCDVYAPCAVGATLNADTIPRLGCAIVAGSANNQLDAPEDAERLAERGILYAPDYVVNAGGAMAFTLVYAGERRVEELERRVSEIGNTLDEIFTESTERGESPVLAAARRVQIVLDRAKSGGAD
jgi:leucine dehydrogenase